VNCANCEKMDCYEGKDCVGIARAVVDRYLSSEDDSHTARVASSVEARFYGKLTRLGELIRFAREMSYRHLGIAFCIGLSQEAKTLQAVLEREGFTVSSVCCKVCGIMKERLQFEKIDEENPEAMCNPLGQAEILNRDKVNLNIICGLCIGHDILFSAHSRAPVTTFIVKDRVLAHNPAGAIYSRYHLKKWL